MNAHYRQNERFDARGLAAQVVCVDKPYSFSGTVEDIALGGMFIRTSMRIPEGSMLSVQLLRNDRHVRVCHARVIGWHDAVSASSTLQGAAARHRPAGLRVSFEAMTAQQTEDLQKVLGNVGAKEAQIPSELRWKAHAERAVQLLLEARSQLEQRVARIAELEQKLATLQGHAAISR
jgi:hypothetical protein